MHPLRLHSILLALLLPVPVVAQPAAPAALPAAPAPAKKFGLETYAALGSDFARNSQLPELGWSESEFNAFIDGVRAAVRGQPYASDRRVQDLQEAVNQRLQQLAAAEQNAKLARLAEPGGIEAYMKEAAKKLHLEIADSGLGYVFVSPGGSIHPGPDDTIVVTWQVTAADMKTEFPQLAVNNARLKVSDLLPGLAEGVQMMTKGGSGLLVLPPDLSFGKGPWPPDTARGQPLIFTIKLTDIIASR
jgi:FKBP-type peptidyl-prolyl cis-trans isomerase